VNRLFDRSNHDLSVINGAFTISAGAVVLIGVKVNDWFEDRPFSLPVVGIFVTMLALLIVSTAAANKKPACSRFLCYLVAAPLSASFPWIAMLLTAHDLAPQYPNLWLYPIGLASWAFAREFTIMLANILNWERAR
jgi:hypothetical protein